VYLSNNKGLYQRHTGQVTHSNSVCDCVRVCVCVCVCVCVNIREGMLKMCLSQCGLLYAVTNYHRLNGLKNKDLVLIVQQAWEFKIKVLRGAVSYGDLFLILQMAVLLYSHMGERRGGWKREREREREGISYVSFIRAWTPFLRAPPSWLNLI
jgi:hypothetical protein